MLATGCGLLIEMSRIGLTIAADLLPKGKGRVKDSYDCSVFGIEVPFFVA